MFYKIRPGPAFTTGSRVHSKVSKSIADGGGGGGGIDPMAWSLKTHRYKHIIIAITLKMGTGMADYAHKAATTGSIYLDTMRTSEYWR